MERLKINDQEILLYNTSQENDPAQQNYKILLPYNLQDQVMSYYHRQYNGNHLGIMFWQTIIYILLAMHQKST